MWDFLGDMVDGPIKEGVVDGIGDMVDGPIQGVVDRMPVCYTNNRRSRIKYKTTNDQKEKFLRLLVFKIVLEEDVSVFKK